MDNGIKIYDFRNEASNETPENCISKGMPCILRGLEIGPCSQKWTVDYLKNKCGSKTVTIHVSQDEDMDFVSKNFQYKVMEFGKFIEEAAKEDHEVFFNHRKETYYLRALGKDVRKERANFGEQFPELTPDILIPNIFPQNLFFSSVFRISSPGVRLWTHYDTMDNILIEVTGRKRITFFAPSDARFLYMEGDKSLVVNPELVDVDRFPDFSRATSMQVEIEAGDVVFIPAMWFHNVKALDFSVAVNVFWFHLAPAQYDPKDVYGNKEPLCVQHAANSIATVCKRLNDLPLNFRHIYAQQLIQKLRNTLM